MSLIRWRSQNLLDPFADLFSFTEEKSWSPAVDICDNKNNLVIKADIPGMTQKEIDVSVENDVLRIKGIDGVQSYLVDKIQNIYESQGIPINDKHFEVVIRKMSDKVSIETDGDTALLPGELVSKNTFEPL